jgi:hypothetical protein
MKLTLKLILAAGVGSGAVGLAASPVTAMPASGLDPALAAPVDSAKSVETVRLICRRRCHWVPGWRRYWWGPGYGYYGPGPWWRYRYGYYPWWPYAGWSPYLYGYYW